MIGLTSYGAYIPRLRLSRRAIVEANVWANSALRGLAKGERAMCNWDEDSVTMAVEASRDALAGRDAASIGAVYLASTTLPFEDRQNAGIVRTALGLRDDLTTIDVTSSQRAATSALIAALGAVESGRDEILLAASENRATKAGAPQEPLYGDAAAAVTIGRDNVIAALEGTHSFAVDFVDHYRGQNREFDYTWEERWIRDEGYFKLVPEAVGGLLRKLSLGPAEIGQVIFPGPAAIARGLAKRLGIPETAFRRNLDGLSGEAGAAHPLLMLADALGEAEPGTRLLVLGFGQGCDALLFRVTDAIAGIASRDRVGRALARRKEETNYNKFLAFNNLVTREKGMRSELDNQTALTTLYRNRDMILGLVGGVCRQCGTRQFPKSNVCVNPNCSAMHSQDDFRFADVPARIMTWSADHLTYTPDPPAHYGMIQFEDGGRFLANFTDVDVGGVEVGMTMRMMFRIRDYDDVRGFRRYFWKAAPAAAGEG